MHQEQLNRKPGDPPIPPDVQESREYATPGKLLASVHHHDLHFEWHLQGADPTELVSPCRCGTMWYCLKHPEPEHTASVNSASQHQRPDMAFPVNRRVIRLDPDLNVNHSELEFWFTKERFAPLGPLVPDKPARMQVLRLLWTYREIFAEDLQDIPPTDLIYHRVALKEGTPIHSEKQRRYAGQKQFWLRKIIQEGIDAGMYEKTFHANDRLSGWNAAHDRTEEGSGSSSPGVRLPLGL